MSYPARQWEHKIKDYLDWPWSRRVGFFAADVIEMLPPNQCILELGCGAAQDAIGFAQAGHTVVATDGIDAAFDEVQERIDSAGLSDAVQLAILDVTEPFSFDNESFDAVYAQLSLHYFDDATMHEIFKEIFRVLRPNGHVCVLLNSKYDPEFQASDQPENGIIYEPNEDMIKRYLTIQMLKPFISDFEAIELNNNGRSAKDEDKGTKGLLRFIGRKAGSGTISNG